MCMQWLGSRVFVREQVNRLQMATLAMGVFAASCMHGQKLASGDPLSTVCNSSVPALHHANPMLTVQAQDHRGCRGLGCWSRARITLEILYRGREYRLVVCFDNGLVKRPRRERARSAVFGVMAQSRGRWARRPLLRSTWHAPCKIVL